MLLAGRLKDLLNGRLVCAQLAIDDLIKDATGDSALGSLREALVNMKSAIDGLKAATGYDKILQGINQALGQINTVFSLGGLCPSPVRAPQIPDVLAQLNSNMFGQASNILNALGKVSNPSMCLGGGPGGFGINWNSMPGSLRNLRDAIKQAKDSGLGSTPALQAFERNLKSQTSRLKSEIRRLEKNLADPLGINNKLNTAKSLQRAKSISDGYQVKDSRGITHDNVLKTMVSADIESVIDSGDRTPVKYITKPILDYCGDIVGYEKVAVSGDPAYIGWDPNADPALNTARPTVNPIAGFGSYTYTFKQEGTAIRVYDTQGDIADELILNRGRSYRLSVELLNQQIQFYSDADYNTVWTEGLQYSRNPAYGKDMEVIIPDAETVFEQGELDWSVLIENPTTPNILYWSTLDRSQSGSFAITGETVIPVADRIYDLSMAVRKANLNLIHIDELGLRNEQSVNRTYTGTTKIFSATGGFVIFTDTEIPVSVSDEESALDEQGNPIPDIKIIKTVSKISSNLHLITKRYVSISDGLSYNQIYLYISDTRSEQAAESCVLLKFDDPLEISNSAKLPYTDQYSYKLTTLRKVNGEFIPVSTPVSNSDETKFELIVSGDRQFIRWNLTEFSEADKNNIPPMEFILQTDIEIDPADTDRTFINSDPTEYRTFLYFKLADGSAIESTIVLN